MIDLGRPRGKRLVSAAFVPLTTGASTVARLLRTLPFTSTALLLAAAVCLAFWIDFFGKRAIFDPLPRWLRFPMLPGGFCFYVVGTFTASPTLAWMAFVIGTMVVYLGIGLAVDGTAWLVRRCRRTTAGAAGDREIEKR
jgi:hypothetical protein